MSLVTSSATGWKGPSDVLDHATSEIASGSKPGIDAKKKLPWPPLIKMDTAVKAKVEKLFNLWQPQ